MKIRTLQKKLYQKAKSEPETRFHLLYDKVHRADILYHAYLLAKSNDGSPGVDGETFERIEKRGVEVVLAELEKELKEETYRPGPVRRVYLDKPDGGKRPLGIPNVRDRIVQTAAKLVLEPIFEADFTDSAYGYRPGRGANGAVQAVHAWLQAGHTDVVDADLSKYFDTIPHAELMKSVARRVSDGKMLGLIKMWLTTPVEERDERGRRHLTGGKNSTRGTPQGGVISPLLANIYMRRFLKFWEQQELPRKLQAHIVNYADDFVILCRGSAQGAHEAVQQIIGKLKLTLNEKKTRVVNAWREPFDFLGYTFGQCYAVGTGRPYLGAKPAKKAQQRLYERLRTIIHRGNTAPRDDVTAAANRVLRGWANYFSYGTLSQTYRRLDYLVGQRFRKWLCRRHKVVGRGTRRFPDEAIYAPRYGVGLVRLQELLRRRRSHACGETSPRAGCGKSASPVR
jgi:RNA-directed DNA polymerase